MAIKTKHETPRRLSVSAKISIGFSIVLLLHVSIAVIGHYGLTRADRDFADYDRLRQQVETFDEIDRTVETLEKHVLLFAFSGYRGPELRATELQGRLDDLIQQAHGFSSTDTDRDYLRGMLKHLNTHRELFAAVVVDREKRRKLVNEELMTSGATIDLGIRKLKVAEQKREHVLAADAAFQSAQMNAMQFVIAPDSARVRQAKKHLAKATEHLTLCQGRRPNDRYGVDLAPTITAVAEYEKSFIQMVQATRGYLHLVNVVLAGESVEFRRLAGEVRSQQSSRVEVLSLKMASDRSQFRFASTLFSLVTIILGVSAAWLINRDVAPPLNAIAETFDNLVDGKQCANIPGIDRGDELGRLAVAAQVFKDQAYETKRLFEESKRSEVELNYANEQLKAQTVVLSTMAEEAHAATLAKSDFLANMSHELRTPLNAIIGFSEGLVERRDRHSLNDHQADRLLKINRSGQHLLSVINDILDISKVEAGKIEVHSSPFDVCVLAAEVADIAEELSRPKSQVGVHLEIDPNLPTLASDRERVKQILINLVANAVKFTEQGRVVIRIRHVGNQFQMCVEDTGIGIPAHHCERVFDKFFQLRHSCTNSIKGTGLGLAICKTFADLIGASLSVESTVGVGSIFSLSVPETLATIEQSYAGTSDENLVTS
jgi:signal transduction histidine kinase